MVHFMKYPLGASFRVFVALLLTSGSAYADGVVRDAFGATSTGRGGTNIAHSDNGAVLLNNPAGILNAPGEGLFEFGFDTVITDLDYADPENNDNARTNPLPLPGMAYFRRSENEDWAAGIGIFAPAGFSSSWDIENPVMGDSRYKSFGALMKVLPAFAYRATDRLSLGATFGVAASHVELETPFYLQTGALAGVPARLDLQATGAAPTWSLGLQFEATERTTMGLVYSSEDRFELDGSLKTSVFGLGPNPVPSRFDAEVDLVWPQSVGAGIRHRVNDWQRASLDIIWFDWSHAFDRVDMKLTNSSNPLFTAMLGPVIRDSILLDWDDSISVRTGYEWFYSETNIFRMGYTHNTRQLPSATLTPPRGFNCR